MSEIPTTTQKRSRYHEIETAQRIKIGAEVISMLGRLAPTKTESREDMWHELIGQEVLRIVGESSHG